MPADRGTGKGRSRTPAARGFTVTELIVVMLIIALLGGMIAPAVSSSMRRGRLSEGVAAVTSSMRVARSLAIASGEIYNVNFIKTPPHGLEIPEYALNPGDPWTRKLPHGTEFGSGTPDTIFFMPDGGAWGPGFDPPVRVRVRLTEEYSRGRDEYHDILVRPLSGRVEVLDLHLE